MSPLRTAVVAGASGYVGRHLTGTLDVAGVRVRTIGRGPEADARWGDDRGLTAVLDGADLLVNPGGRSAAATPGATPMGAGEQVFSWVHVDEVTRAILHLHGDPSLAGPVNVAAPEPVGNAELMAAVQAALGRPYGLPLPAPVLEFGARVIRTEAELVLKSRWVRPGVLLDSGFHFAHPTLPEALAAIATETPRGLLPVTLG